MQIYLAPLQGLTDWIFREAFTANIGKFDKTFSPFIRVQQGEFYRPSQCNDILPEHNRFQQPVPQFLGNDFESFLRFEELCLKNEYNEVNINMGCPYPMVTGKKMGAGLLPYPDKISELFEKIFAGTQLEISVKCRLGMENSNEFKQLIPVFNNLPFTEIIIHPRIGKQQYKGEVDHNTFAQYTSELKHSICYNGDILTVEDIEAVQKLYPGLDKIMIGRGILQNPFLIFDIRQQTITTSEKIKMLKDFHFSLIELSKQKYSGDLHFIKRFEELWSYHSLGFQNGHKIFKQIKKCKNLAQYEAVIYKAINEME